MTGRIDQRSRLSSMLWIGSTLALRGLGSGVAVVLTVLASRFMTAHEAARFFLVFNITTIAAISFRWGLDDMIIRRIAAAATTGRVAPAVASLSRLSHRRVLRWSAVGALVACASTLIPLTALVGIGPVDLAAAVTISALIAVTASAGRMHQGLGRSSRATVILNVAIPGMALVALLLMVGVGLAVKADRLLAAYAIAGLLAYVTVVWIAPVAGRRPLPLAERDAESRCQDRADVQAARRLGWVVLSQQALNWGALLIVPTAYGAPAYTDFMVNFKVASLISLVMLAVNFTLSSQIATLHARGDIPAVRNLTRLMLLAVFGSSTIAAAAVFLAHSAIYDYARVDQRLSVVLAILVVGQVFFAVSAVYALVLTMSHDEAFLMRVQGALTASGLALFILLSFAASLEIACLAFPVTYGALSVTLCRRVTRTVLAAPVGPATQP